VRVINGRQAFVSPLSLLLTAKDSLGGIRELLPFSRFEPSCDFFRAFA
jgi:hypothetical protein